MKADNEIRCSAVAQGYGRVLFEMAVPQEAVEQTREMLAEVPRLAGALMNPVIAMKKKLSVIEKVFPGEMVNFLKTVCSYQRIGLLDEIFASYDKMKEEEKNVVRAVLSCTTFPGEEQKKGLEQFLCRKYHAREARIEIRRDDSLMGGFILRVGSDEYDRSVKGSADRLAQSLHGR